MIITGEETRSYEALKNELEYFKKCWSVACEHVAEACVALGVDTSIETGEMPDTWALRKHATKVRKELDEAKKGLVAHAGGGIGVEIENVRLKARGAKQEAVACAARNLLQALKDDGSEEAIARGVRVLEMMINVLDEVAPQKAVA